MNLQLHKLLLHVVRIPLDSNWRISIDFWRLGWHRYCHKIQGFSPLPDSLSRNSILATALRIISNANGISHNCTSQSIRLGDNALMLSTRNTMFNVARLSPRIFAQKDIGLFDWKKISTLGCADAVGCEAAAYNTRNDVDYSWLFMTYEEASLMQTHCTFLQLCLWRKLTSSIPNECFRQVAGILGLVIPICWPWRSMVLGR